MSAERNSNQQGQQEPPQQEGELWIELGKDQNSLTPWELLRTMQSLKFELQSIKVDNLRERKNQHKLNKFLLQNLTEMKQNPVHTSSIMMRKTYKDKRDKE